MTYRDQNRLSSVLKTYRREHKITQAQLSELLNVDVRTVRRYEAGNNDVRDIGTLSYIAEVLGIDPVLLGVVSENVPISDRDTADLLWNTVKHAHFNVARVKASDILTTGVPGIETLYAIAYVYNHTSTSREVDTPLRLYCQVYDMACELKNTHYQALALTYIGDMLQRSNHAREGIESIKEAITISPSLSVKGNATQLLARAYTRLGDEKSFDSAIKTAETIGGEIETSTNEALLSNPTSQTRGQFNLATVYEEYGKYEGMQGRLYHSLDLLQQAEKYFNQYWSSERSMLLLTSSKAIAFIKAGDIPIGTQYALETVDLCRKYGNVRTLERVVGVLHQLEAISQQAHKASIAIREKLLGNGEW